MNTNIEIGKGFSQLQFGLSREELKKLLGKPDEIESIASDFDGGSIENWHYDDLELSASFEEELDWKLVAFSITSTKYKLSENSIIGMSKGQVQEYFTEEQFGECEIIVESEKSELFSFEDKSINIWLEDGQVVEFLWGVLWEDEENPEWPIP